MIRSAHKKGRGSRVEGLFDLTLHPTPYTLHPDFTGGKII